MSSYCVNMFLDPQKVSNIQLQKRFYFSIKNQRYGFFFQDATVQVKTHSGIIVITTTTSVGVH